MTNILIVYYSYTNHTKLIAEKIKNELSCDILELKPQKPYSKDYDAVVELAQTEVNEDFTPCLEENKIDLSKYATIVLGTPVWWYTMASPVRTFLKTHNLSNKTIIPFATNAGWLGHTFEDIQSLCPNSKIINALSIKFAGDYQANKIITPENEIDIWINRIKNNK